MPGWNHYGTFRPKPCCVCGVEFSPKSGVNKFCSEKCKGKWKYVTGVVSTESQYREISGNWSRYFSRLLGERRRKKISRDDLFSLLEKQNGRCALSGVLLTCKLEKGVRFGTNASIDRIVVGGEYEVGNIQLVCSALNSWRGDTPLEEFIIWCERVSEMAKKKRDLEKEYNDYHAKPEQKKRRAQRNAARRKAMAEGRVSKGDGKEVDHVNAPRTGSLDSVPTRVVPKEVNRKRQPKRS